MGARIICSGFWHARLNQLVCSRFPLGDLVIEEHVGFISQMQMPALPEYIYCVFPRCTSGRTCYASHSSIVEFSDSLPFNVIEYENVYRTKTSQEITVYNCKHLGFRTKAEHIEADNLPHSYWFESLLPLCFVLCLILFSE